MQTPNPSASCRRLISGERTNMYPTRISAPDAAGLGAIGTIFRIKRYAIHDGPGIRTTVFFKGCPLRCWWCHNPEGQQPCIEAAGTADSRATPSCTIGRHTSVAALVREIENDVIFYDASGGGVTFSGGEPLLQPRFLEALLSACRQRDIHTTVDTCGYAPAGVIERIAAKTDLFLFDLKLMDEDLHIRYTGVSNRPVLENLQKLARSGRPLIIRFALIPGITDRRDNPAKVRRFLQQLGGIQQVDILPFHATAEGKYQRLARAHKTARLKPPPQTAVSRMQEFFRTAGFNVTVGG